MLHAAWTRLEVNRPERPDSAGHMHGVLYSTSKGCCREPPSGPLRQQHPAQRVDIGPELLNAQAHTRRQKGPHRVGPAGQVPALLRTIGMHSGIVQDTGAAKTSA